MSSSLPSDDLRRRYREADWVSEFQRLWAIFNHWYGEYFHEKTDRDCINRLKSADKVSQWVNDIIGPTGTLLPYRVKDGLLGSYPHFASNNHISLFFRAVAGSQVIEPRINYPWRAGVENRVQTTNAIILSELQFISAYRAHAEALDSPTGIIIDLTFHQTLLRLGVQATGCCFFRMSPLQSTDEIHFAEDVLERLRSRDELQDLVCMIESSYPTELASDVVETLYNVRNVAIHGSLDFLNEWDNAAARAGYDVLDSLIRYIRDSW